MSVLYDDRQKVSPGVKFKDSELLGVPTIVVVGKSLANGVVEVKDRATGERREVSVDDAVAEVVREVRGSRRVMAAVRTRRSRRWSSTGAARSPRGTRSTCPSSGGSSPARCTACPSTTRTMPVEELAEADSLALRIHRAEEQAWRAGPGDARERQHRGDPRVGRGRRGPRPAPAGARGIPAVLGAAHAHRPAGAPALGGAARPRAQGGRAVQHHLDPGLPPRGVPARRRPRPARRRRLLLGDPRREAAPRGVPRRVRGRRRRAAGGGLRRRPAVRGRPRAAAGRHARHLDPAQRHPRLAAGRRSTSSPTPRPTSCSTSWASSTAGGWWVRPRPRRPAHGAGRLRRRLDRRGRGRRGAGAAAGPAARLPRRVPGAAAGHQQDRLDLRHRDELDDLLAQGPSRPAHGAADGRRGLPRRHRRGTDRPAHPQVGVQPDHPRHARRRRRLHRRQAVARPRDGAALRRPPAHRRGDGHGVRHRRLRRRARTRHRLVPRLRARRADGLRVPRGQRQGQDRQLRHQPRRPHRLRPGGHVMWRIGP